MIRGALEAVPKALLIARQGVARMIGLMGMPERERFARRAR